jgi:hypothetical protein
MIKNMPKTENTMPIRIFKPFNSRFVTSGLKYFAPIILSESMEKKVINITNKK